MVTPSMTGQRPTSYGTAKRLRHNVQTVSNAVLMTTVVCDECGARFAITHIPSFQDVALAEKQVAWLKDKFVWDHIQENKHSGSILLPSPQEMNPAPVAS
jgi:hypothetical protein